MILLIDNYDSFTYNLVQYLGEIHKDVQVVRNDAVTCNEIEALAPSAIVISPGPGRPGGAGISLELVRRFSGKIPILGVCLGHQAIGEAFGGIVVHAKQLFHGKASYITLDASAPIFRGLPEKLRAARYHSLALSETNLPKVLKVIARDEAGEIMAVTHETLPVVGLQFHPESILTQYGKRILRNFVCTIAGIPSDTAAMPSMVPPGERNLLKPYIKKVIDGQDLIEEEAYDAMNCIMEGDATDSQIASFVTALRMKGETIDEITGFAKLMRNKAATVPAAHEAVDIVGTGGDMMNTFNISTTAAIVTAAAGAKVAKHGNRSVSSRSGSADVLEALGVRIGITPEQAGECLEKVGLCFMFAPAFHHSMRFAATPRREIGVRSVFNILGPLANPATAQHMMLGVYDAELLEIMGRVLMNLGIVSAMVVHGEDALDEISITAKTKICQTNGDKLTQFEISPEQFGFKRHAVSDVVGGSPKENAAITRAILAGQTGPKRDIVLLNAAAALHCAQCCPSIDEGITRCAEAIDSGAAAQKLDELIGLTNTF